MSALVALGDEIPGAKFLTVHLKLRGEGAMTYSYYYERLYTRLSDKEKGAKRAGSRKQGHDWHDDEDEVCTPNLGVWRKLDILALNPNNEKTLRLGDENDEADEDDEDDNGSPYKGEAKGSGSRIQAENSDHESSASDSSDDDSNMDGKPKRKAPAPVAMGVDEVRELNKDTADGGAHYIFQPHWAVQVHHG